MKLSFAQLLFLIFVSVNSFSQELIPRSELFKQPNEKSFYPTHTGKYCFWLKENDLVFKDLKSGEKDYISFRNPILSIAPFNKNRVLLISALPQSRTLQLSYYDHDLKAEKYISKAGRIRLVHFTKHGVVYLQQLAPTEQAIYYHYSFQGKTDSLGSYENLDQLFFTNNLEPIAARRMNDNGSFDLLFYKNNAWQKIHSYPYNEGLFLGGLQRVVSVNSQATALYYTSNHESDKNSLYEFDLKSHESKLLASSENTDILPMGTLLDEENKPIYSVSIFAKSQYHVIQDWFQEHLDLLRKKIGPDISVVDPMWNAGVILFRKFTGASNEYFIYKINSQEISFIGQENSHLKNFPIAPRTAFSFKTSDNIELPLHVYLPNGSDKNGDGIPDKPLPTLMYVHGGPWVGLIHFNSWMHVRNFQLLANRGYAVIVGEFRGTTGLGKEITQKSYKKWGTDMARDKAELAKWLIDKGISRKEKIAIWGWSYGGYAAMAGLAFFPEQYACGISMYGLPSLEPEEGTAGYQDASWAYRVGEPDTEMELLKKHSPIYSINQIKKPLLMTTGGQDRRVSKAKNLEMAQNLYEANKEVTFIYYPFEVHDYRDPNSWISFWAYAEEFLAEHLGGKVENGESDRKKGEYELIYLNGEKQISKL